MVTTDLNRIKAVLADPANVSKWCTNRVNPIIETLQKIAITLDVNIRQLFIPTKWQHV